MEFEYKVLTFSNDAAGQASKMDALNKYAERGWSLESETVNQSAYDTVGAARDAACTCFLCGPFCAPFLMNKDRHKIKGEISITLKRSIERRDEERALRAQQEAERLEEDRRFELDRRANIDVIMQEAKLQSGSFYADKKIRNCIIEYLANDRRSGGTVPAYLNCRREGNCVYICDSEGKLLAEYTLDD